MRVRVGESSVGCCGAADAGAGVRVHRLPFHRTDVRRLGGAASGWNVKY